MPENAELVPAVYGRSIIDKASCLGHDIVRLYDVELRGFGFRFMSPIFYVIRLVLFLFLSLCLSVCRYIVPSAREQFLCPTLSLPAFPLVFYASKL